MQGQRVRAIRSWGKHFLVEFDGFAMRVHFMLFGRYRIDEDKIDRNGKTTAPRVSLAFDNGVLNLYACSVQFIEGDLDDVYDWSGDVMADAWDPAQARRKLKAAARHARRRRAARPGDLCRRRQHHQERSAVPHPRASGKHDRRAAAAQARAN